MKTMNRWLVTAGIAGLLCLGAGQALAQGGGGGGGAAGGFGGGNFDPAQFQQQMQQRMMDYYHDQLEVTNDDEWVIIQGRIQKVLDARQDTGFGGMGGMLGAFGRGRRGGNGGAGGGGRGGLGGLLGTPSPEEDALQKAIDGNASNAVIKAALARVIEVRQAKQAKLEKAQDELRKVLSVRQEAIATLGGLL